MRIHKRLNSILFQLGTVALITLCTSFILKHTAHPGKHQEGKGLKDYYRSFFYMGVAVSPRSLSGDKARLIRQQFNSITPEGSLKTKYNLKKKPNLS